MNEDNMKLEVITRSELAARIQELKAERDERLLKYIQTHPEMSYHEIGRKFGLVAEHVSLIARKNNVRRLRGRRSGCTFCRR
jgi:hypothetical protein